MRGTCFIMDFYGKNQMWMNLGIAWHNSNFPFSWIHTRNFLETEIISCTNTWIRPPYLFNEVLGERESASIRNWPKWANIGDLNWIKRNSILYRTHNGQLYRILSLEDELKNEIRFFQIFLSEIVWRNFVYSYVNTVMKKFDFDLKTF